MSLHHIIFLLSQGEWRLIGWGAIIVVLVVVLYVSWKSRYFSKS